MKIVFLFLCPRLYPYHPPRLREAVLALSKVFESCPSSVLSVGGKKETENMEKEFIKNKDNGGAKKDQNTTAEQVVDTTSSKRARQVNNESASLSPPSPKRSRLFFKKSMLYSRSEYFCW